MAAEVSESATHASPPNDVASHKHWPVSCPLQERVEERSRVRIYRAF